MGDAYLGNRLTDPGKYAETCFIQLMDLMDGGEFWAFGQL